MDIAWHDMGRSARLLRRRSESRGLKCADTHRAAGVAVRYPLDDLCGQQVAVGPLLTCAAKCALAGLAERWYYTAFTQSGGPKAER